MSVLKEVSAATLKSPLDISLHADSTSTLTSTHHLYFLRCCWKQVSFMDYCGDPSAKAVTFLFVSEWHSVKSEVRILKQRMPLQRQLFYLPPIVSTSRPTYTQIYSVCYTNYYDVHLFFIQHTHTMTDASCRRCRLTLSATWPESVTMEAAWLTTGTEGRCAQSCPRSTPRGSLRNQSIRLTPVAFTTHQVKET